MFKKIINNLSVNPSTIGQFVFYTKRLKRERSIRVLGVIVMIMTLMVQLIAAAVPAERSLAASSNDIISGGVSSKADLVSKCRNNAQIKAIYARFDISCDHIASGTTTETTINASAYDFWSIGRTPLSSNGISSDDWGEVKLNAGGTSIYQRPLKAWGANVRYAAFNIKANNKNYWIIKDCGNLVTIGAYSRKPSLEVRKELLSPKQVKPGDTVKFRITYRNPVPESVAIDFRLRDLLNPYLELVGMDGRNAFIDGDPVTNLKGLGDSTTFKEVNLVAKVKANTPNTEICNIARVSADVVGVVDSNKVCFNVFTPQTPPPPVTPTTPPPVTPPETPTTPPPVTPKCTIPGKTDLPVDSPLCKYDAPDGICVSSTGFLNNGNKDFKVSTKAVVSGTTKVTKYTFVLDENASTKREVKTSELTAEQTYTGLKQGDHKVQTTVDFTNESNETVSKTCVAEITIAEDARLTQTKAVFRGEEDMNGKKVNPGDTLQFRLTTKNVTATAYQKFNGEDFFGDVLDYADIIDANELSKQGLVLGQDKILRWTTNSIGGNSEEVKTITVKVKPITPSTNRPSNISSEYDCIISNKYGNQVTMSVSCPLVKTIERTSTSLPNTGPGTTALIAFIITVVGGYFAARARLMSKEAEIIRQMHQYSSQGV